MRQLAVPINGRARERAARPRAESRKGKGVGPTPLVVAARELERVRPLIDRALRVGERDDQAAYGGRKRHGRARDVHAGVVVALCRFTGVATECAEYECGCVPGCEAFAAEAAAAASILRVRRAHYSRRAASTSPAERMRFEWRGVAWRSADTPRGAVSTYRTSSPWPSHSGSTRASPCGRAARRPARRGAPAPGAGWSATPA